MPLASLILLNRDALPLAAVFLLVALAVLLFAWRSQSTLPRGIRNLSFLLKALGFTLLALILLQPEWVDESEEEETQKGVHILAFAADNSRSLAPAEDATAPFADTFADPDWRTKLDEVFQTRDYLFDARLRRAPLASATHTGTASDLHGAIETLTQRFDGHPLAGIVLFTDGNATDQPSAPINTLTNLPPIYPVLISSSTATKTPPPDLALGPVTVTQTAFEEAPVTLLAEVRATAASDRPLAVDLIGPAGVLLATQTWTPTTSSAREILRFTHRPIQLGPTHVTLRIRPAATNTTALTEATALNNERTVAIDRDRGPYRVLYVSGRPNWEFKFLNRALQADQEVDLVGLIRIARREPKFSFRGRSGESSNPLFRGFGNQPGEDPEYDQPVLVRFNTLDKDELADGFPTTAEDLFSYRAIILDDVEAAFFSPDQQTLIADFVSRRGGGLLALGGQECFQHGEYADTPLGDLLPVYADAATALAPDTTFRLDLTREGWLQPWARLRATEDADRNRLETMPAFQTAHGLTAIKPGASVIASALAGGDRHPALVTQRFGRGRTAALLIADLWRWGMKREDQRDDFNQAWRQLVRWLIADVPAHLDLATAPGPGIRHLTLTARDPDFQPLTDATVALTLTTPDGVARPLTALPSADRAGTWEAATPSTTNGAYRVSATFTTPDGAPIGTTETTWSENRLADELTRLTPNREFLQRLADQTGGQLLTLDDLPALADSIPRPTVTVTRTRRLALWNLPLTFLLALALFLAEWGLRRSKGAA